MKPVTRWTALICFSMSWCAHAAAPSAVLRDEHAVWDTNRLSVDAAKATIASSPKLASHSELVLDRAGFHSISPLLLAVLAAQSDVLDAQPPRDQVDAFIAAVARMFYLGRSNAAPNTRMTAAAVSQLNTMSFGLDAIARTFVFGADESRLSRLVDAYVEQFGTPISRDSGFTEAAAPANFLRLPWLVGQTGWSFNGVHSNTGGCPNPVCTSPRSSIDFSRGWPAWNSVTSDSPVHAAHAGTVSVASSCNLRIANANGFATNYYHLSNIAVANQSTVVAGQKIAEYANTSAQALCQGGSSTGPHVHFSLLQNGAYIELDQSDLSGWRINATSVTRDYDADTARMFLSRDSVNSCAYNNACNPTSWAMHTLPTAMPSNKLCDLDIDGNGVVSASTDGLLLLRYLVGLRGFAITDGITFSGATRTDGIAIANFIATKSYDLNIDGAVTTLKDGLYAMRAAQGATGATLAGGTGTFTGGLLLSGNAVAAYIASCK